MPFNSLNRSSFFVYPSNFCYLRQAYLSWKPYLMLYKTLEDLPPFEFCFCAIATYVPYFSFSFLCCACPLYIVSLFYLVVLFLLHVLRVSMCVLIHRLDFDPSILTKKERLSRVLHGQKKLSKGYFLFFSVFYDFLHIIYFVTTRYYILLLCILFMYDCYYMHTGLTGSLIEKFLVIGPPNAPKEKGKLREAQILYQFPEDKYVCVCGVCNRGRERKSKKERGRSG